MKRSLRLLTLFFICLFANNCFAQVTDPLNQHKKVNDDKWSSESEEVISKKKKKETNSNTTIIVNEETQKPKSKIEISNSCPEDISVELISLVGNIASQKVSIAIKYINHDVNQTISIRKFKAYNEEGDEFYTYHIKDNSTFTDVPVKVEWEVGQMLPSKNSKLPVISFNIKDCVVEMRNIPIEWR